MLVVEVSRQRAAANPAARRHARVPAAPDSFAGSAEWRSSTNPSGPRGCPSDDGLCPCPSLAPPPYMLRFSPASVQNAGGSTTFSPLMPDAAPSLVRTVLVRPSRYPITPSPPAIVLASFLQIFFFSF